jgi:hypothetical protein
MCFAPLVLVAFWFMPWSEPFRRACLWFTLETQPLRGKQPDKDVPRWLRPLFLQRWVGNAVAQRLAWLEWHPEITPYRYGRQSELHWHDAAWAAYDRQCLRELSQQRLLWIFGREVERLLRLAEHSPSAVDNGDWTRAALGISLHVAQVYAELRPRLRATRARYLLREELRQFVSWAGVPNSRAELGVEV